MHSLPGDFPPDALSLQNAAIYKRRIVPRRKQMPPGKLRIAIVCENLMPKVDGVTRCLARLLAHLRKQGHECVVLGPESGMKEYETHSLVGTAGVPLVLYPGLKLNFLRPLFLRTIADFDPDVIHVVDPIWLGAQVLWAMEMGWCGEEWTLGRKPVVASYHTNLPTYASLFGLSWLEPVMWHLLKTLHAKCLLTACPSQSTADILTAREFGQVRIWPRGVDLSLFGTRRRQPALRKKWGATPISDDLSSLDVSKDVVFPPTPPPSPDLLPIDDNEAIVVLYVGRISHEKNLMLLLHSFSKVLKSTPSWTVPPRLVFVGDGPARTGLQAEATRLNVDVVFAGHIDDPKILAEHYASADVFGFPSYTETFGQVVCEALASGLPVVGLDAEGTRDLVTHERTGLLLTKSKKDEEWCDLLRDPTSQSFKDAVETYTGLLSKVVFDRRLRKIMSRRACTEGIEGRTWDEAMEKMVDCYREAVETSEKIQQDPSLKPSRWRGPPDHWWRFRALLALCMALLSFAISKTIF